MEEGDGVGFDERLRAGVDLGYDDGANHVGTAYLVYFVGRGAEVLRLGGGWWWLANFIVLYIL